MDQRAAATDREAVPTTIPSDKQIRWICGGFRKDGSKCHTVLATMKLAPTSEVIIRCPKCGTWNVREKE